MGAGLLQPGDELASCLFFLFLFFHKISTLECNTVRIKTGVKETNKSGLLYISTEVHIACSVVIVSYWAELCLVVDKVDGVS